jgi:hypothetical protein
MTPARRSLFALAENLGMTVYQLERVMPVKELVEWIEFYEWRNRRQAQAPEPEELNERTLSRMFK